MSDYLHNLITRNREETDDLRPRKLSVFETPIVWDRPLGAFEPNPQGPESDREAVAKAESEPDRSTRLTAEPSSEFVQRARRSESHRAEPAVSSSHAERVNVSPELRPSPEQPDARGRTDSPSIAFRSDDTPVNRQAPPILLQPLERISVPTQPDSPQRSDREDRTTARDPEPRRSPKQTMTPRVHEKEQAALLAPAPQRALSETLKETVVKERIVAANGDSPRPPKDRSAQGILVPEQLSPIHRAEAARPQASAPAAGAASPTIHVSIGRVEVRAASPPVRQIRQPRQPKSMSLDEYFEKVAPGGRR